MTVARLPFVLPDWTRAPAWVNEAARDLWGPRFARIIHARWEIERLAVVDGVRAAAIHMLSREGLDSAIDWANAHGVRLELLRRHGMATGPYASTTRPPVPGEAQRYRVAYVRDVAPDWATTDDTVGVALGYPTCCRQAFDRRYYGPDAWTDPTWPTFLASNEDASGPPACHVLLRWAGVRMVSHLPCTFRCEATVSVAAELADVGRRHGFAEELEWIEEALSWPVTWDSRAGVLILTTPLFRLTASTDALTGATVERPGRLPAGTPTGLGRLLAPPTTRPITQTAAWQDGVRAAALIAP